MSEPLRMVSPDGETWYECPPEKFAEFLADEDFDCWVDMSDKELGVCHMTLSTIRKMAKGETPPPNTLYGIPIVFTENKP